MQAYIQHGTGTTEALSTESVEIKEAPLKWQLMGLSYTATGYGAKIPTCYMIKYQGKWRRVYYAIWSNIGTTYIGKRSDNLIVRMD